MAHFIASASLVDLLLACLAAGAAATLLSLASGWAMERAAWAKGRKVFAVPLRRGQLRTEAIGTALFVIVFTPALAIALWSGVLRFSGGWPAQVLGFVVPLVGFQIFYYWLHRAMHARALFWMHRWHHESHVTTPLTGFSMHPVEALGWVVGMLAPAALLARYGLLGLGGFASFLAFVWFGNITGHANAEIFSFRTTRTSSTFANAVVFHSLHHARFNGHYGFATATMDRIFRTEWRDWLALHERIWAGRPLARLQERADDSATPSASERTAA